MTAHLWSPSLPQHQLIYAEHDDGLRSLSWSPNGKHIASAGDDYLMKVWDIQTGATLFTYTGHAKNRAGNIVCVAWSPDGNFLASAGDDVTVQICDAQYGHHLYTYTGHTGSQWVRSLSWSPTSVYIASGDFIIGEKTNTGTVRVWEAV